MSESESEKTELKIITPTGPCQAVLITFILPLARVSDSPVQGGDPDPPEKWRVRRGMGELWRYVRTFCNKAYNLSTPLSLVQSTVLYCT